jgi:hypothetical protein
MPPAENEKFRRRAGRREKPLPDDGNPRTILAGRLRELKSACGSPTYDELAAHSGVYKTGLLEAASATRLPRWYVVKGYVEGCWKYHESKFSKPFADAGDLSPWRHLYREAGGTMPEECPPSAHEGDEQRGPQLVPADCDKSAEPALPPLPAGCWSSSAGGPPPAWQPSAVLQSPSAGGPPVLPPPRLALRHVWRWAALSLGLLFLIVLAWPVGSPSRLATSSPAAWCAYVTALPAPVLSAPSAGATLVKLKDLGNGIEILPLPHPPGWWPVFTPYNRPDHNWMPAGVLSPRAAGTRPCPDNKAVAAVTTFNSDSAEEQFAVGSDCRIYHRWQLEVGGPFSRWSSMGGCASAPRDLAVGMNGDGELVAFVISADHAVRYKSQTRPALGPWTGWISLGGDAFTGLRVVSAPDGSSPIRVFASDKNGNPWEDEQAHGNCCWTGWRETQPPSPGPS